jgi:hypothetical protein
MTALRVATLPNWLKAISCLRQIRCVTGLAQSPTAWRRIFRTRIPHTIEGQADSVFWRKRQKC